LLTKHVHQVIKGISDIVGSSVEISLPLGPIDPATKRGFSGVAEFIRQFTRQLSRSTVDLQHTLAQTKFCQG
jgi:hypothetical protein